MLQKGLEDFHKQRRTVPAPDEGFRPLGPGSNLTFSSSAWIVTLDPSTGVAHAPSIPGQSHDEVSCAILCAAACTD
jgi:hypothetical protein